MTNPGGIPYYREGQPAKGWAQRVQGKPIVNLNILDRYLKNPHVLHQPDGDINCGRWYEEDGKKAMSDGFSSYVVRRN